MNGLLLIDKPATWTSFDAVNYVRRMIAQSAGLKPKQVKVGHTGTLDPLATGLLVLVVGTYCRRAQEFSKLDKTYEVTMRLGQTSTTGDEEGDKTAVSDVIPDEAAVVAALKAHTGVLMQVPPAYSAIKVNGVRAYQAARDGKPLELAAREVTVRAIKRESYNYPTVLFSAEVSSGTYIRSLVEDIGTMLGTGAYMSNLRRTTVGAFAIHDAVSPQELTPESLEARLLTVPE